MSVRAQSMVEYAILVVAVVLAVVFPVLLIGLGIALVRKAWRSRAAA